MDNHAIDALKDRQKLLVVEDDPGLLRQLKWHFENYEVIAASTREQALVQLRRHEPMVVLQDLGLPPDDEGVEEGLACLRDILRLAPHTKVILSSDPVGLAMELQGRGERVGILPAGPVEDHARRLYADLRSLDEKGYTVIIAEPAEERGMGTAINDRLRRASASF